MDIRQSTLSRLWVDDAVICPLEKAMKGTAKDVRSVGTGKELSKVLQYLRQGYFIKMALGGEGLAMVMKPGEETPVCMASYTVMDFLKESGILEVVQDGWRMQVFRLSAHFSEELS